MAIPSGMAFRQDVPYGAADEEALLLDVLTPDPLPAAASPAVVWIHDGGWEARRR